MTRIIGGVASGRRLRTPTGDRTRPTSDRVREALFSALESAVGSLAGLRVADLYAGSGAVGLEALSRGAGEVLLVESDRRTAVTVLEANVADLRLGSARVRAEPVAKVLAAGPSSPYDPYDPYDVVFLDPPYALPDADVEADLRLLVEHGWLADDAVVVVERSKRDASFDWPEGLTPGRDRRYGETTLRWATRQSKVEPSP